MSADRFKKGSLIMNFGQNLKRLRLSKNLTQEQVAQKFNITTQTISRWECSSTYPDVLLLPELSKLYGVTIDDLFKESSVESGAICNFSQNKACPPST